MDGKFGIYTEKELKKLKFEDIIKIIILFLIFLSTNSKNKISTKIINIEVVWIDPKVNNNEIKTIKIILNHLTLSNSLALKKLNMELFI